MAGNRLLYSTSFAAVTVTALMNIMNPMILQFTLDSVIGSEPLDTNFFFEWLIGALGGIDRLRANIWICCGLYLAATALNSLFAFIRNRNAAIATENIAKNMKDHLYDHLQKLPYEYHVKAQTGDLIQRCTSDVETIRRFLSSQVVEMARTVIILVFSIAVMLSVNVKITLLALCLVPVIFLFSFIFFSSVKKAFKLSDEKEGELSTVLQENLSGVRVVRAFGRERFETDKFQEKNGALRGLNFRVIRLLAYYWSLSDIICFLQIALVLFYGVYLTTTGVITLGQFIMFNSYVNMMIWPVRQLGRILSDMGKMQVALTRVYEILDTQEERDTPGAEAHDLAGDIVFNDVRFEYEQGKPVLNGLTFTARQGETIAILGATGSGKSTLMHILLRLYDYSGGSITVGGKELHLIDKQHLRARVGIVLQEPFLFSKTIRENLRMAKDEVGDEEMIGATKTAAVHDVIEGFDQGYDTIIGEKGVTLSGGQKQRVAIARTLIKDSDILVFDDSLSAVDTETDAQIRAALKKNKNRATTFIISQRITTLMTADRIFVLEDGQLSDSGTHMELVSRDGLYSRIWNIQSMLEESFQEEAKA